MNVFAELTRDLKFRPGDVIEEPRPLPRERKERKAAEVRSTSSLPKVANPWKLSPVQCEILRQIVEGGQAKTIGASLSISHKTVEIHIARMKVKMEVPSSLQAALLWDRQQRFKGFVPAAVFITDVAGRSQQCVVLARDIEIGQAESPI